MLYASLIGFNPCQLKVLKKGDELSRNGPNCLRKIFLPIEPAVLNGRPANEAQSSCLGDGEHLMNMTARVDVSSDRTLDRHAEDVVLLSDDAVTTTAAEHCALHPALQYIVSDSVIPKLHKT